jgi:hypothetical protein
LITDSVTLSATAELLVIIAIAQTLVKKKTNKYQTHEQTQHNNTRDVQIKGALMVRFHPS